MDYMNDIPAGTTTAKFERAIFSAPPQYPPTHHCTICDKAENPEATLGTLELWICPECKAVLKAMVEDYERRRNIMINSVKHHDD